MGRRKICRQLGPNSLSGKILDGTVPECPRGQSPLTLSIPRTVWSLSLRSAEIISVALRTGRALRAASLNGCLRAERSLTTSLAVAFSVALGIRFAPVSNVVSFAKIGVSKCHSICSASDDLIAHGVKRFRKTAADARALNAAMVLVLPNPRGTTLFPARLYCPCGFAK
jgi:hypothetical protein